MDVEKNIAEIEFLEHIYMLPDRRLSLDAGCRAANHEHDELDTHNPWLRLWEHIRRVSAMWRHK
jgi:hypothetical protein